MTPELAGIPKRIGIKEHIVFVFQELLKRESFDNLSVQSISEACGISRTTFYRLFQDKDDLLIWSYVQQINAACGHVTSEKERLVRILKLMYSNRQYFRRILKSDRGRQVLGDFIFHRSVRGLQTRLTREGDLQCAPDELLTKIEFCCIGAQYITKKWLLEDTGELPDVIADRILDCFPEPVRSFCLMETTSGQPVNSSGNR